MAENYTEGTSNTGYDDQQRLAEEATKKLTDEQEAGIVAKNKQRQEAAEQEAQNRAASEQENQSQEQYNAQVLKKQQQEQEEDFDKMRALGKGAAEEQLPTPENAEPENTEPEMSSDQPVNLEEMKQDLTEALDTVDAVSAPENINFGEKETPTFSMDEGTIAPPPPPPAMNKNANENDADVAEQPYTTLDSGTMSMDELAAMAPKEPATTIDSGTMSMDELANHIAANGPEKPFVPANTYGNQAQKEPDETIRSGTMNMDELANHIAANGPEKPFVPAYTRGNQAQKEPAQQTPETPETTQTIPAAPQTMTENAEEEGMLITDDTFGNQYKAYNFWDSDERKKESKALADSLMNAKDIDGMIEAALFSVPNFILRTWITGATERDYKERYDKEKNAATEEGRKAYTTDILTKTNTTQEEYNELLDAWVMHGTRNSVEGQELLSKLPKKENGKIDFENLTPEQRVKMGKVMKEIPAVRESVKQGLKTFERRVPGDKEIDNIIMGVAGNEKHTCEEFLKEYGDYDKIGKAALAQKQERIECLARAQEQARQEAQQTQGQAPQTPQVQQAVPQTRNTAGYTPSANTTGRTDTKGQAQEPIQVALVKGQLKNVQPISYSQLPGRARAAAGAMKSVAPAIQKNRANANILAQFRNGQKTPQTSANTFTLDMGRNI